MKWHDLKRKQEAPERGWLLAYTRTNVIFHDYEGLAQAGAELADIELLELHLFDQAKEYRCLAARSPRFPDGMIETVEDFDEQEQAEFSGGQKISAVYAVKGIRLLGEKWKGRNMTVLNHVRYDSENGMAVIDNYRLKISEDAYEKI